MRKEFVSSSLTSSEMRAGKPSSCQASDCTASALWKAQLGSTWTALAR